MECMSNYVINKAMVLMTGEYNKYGKFCTRVIEADNTFLVDMKPLEVIDKTLLGLGSDFKGGRKSSKEILGESNMYPIKINENLGIWLFPTKSYNHEYCVWFSLMHVKKTRARGLRRTEVFLSYDHKFLIGMKESSFNQRRQKAEDLRDAMLKNSNTPITFFVEPRKGLNIEQEDDGINPYKIK